MIHLGRHFKLTLALMLGLAFLGFCLWRGTRDLMLELSSHFETAPLIQEGVLESSLGPRLLVFALALVALHVLLGVVAYGFCRLTEIALPRISAGREYLLICVWFLALAALVLLWNASCFPASRFAHVQSWPLDRLNMTYSAIVQSATVASLVAVLAVLAIRARRLALRDLVPWSVPVAILLALPLLAPRQPDASQSSARSSQPHIVIIGIDSLRDDYAGAGNPHRLTPNIDRFLADAHRFSDATSPLARTYPALVALLTGRHPTSTNARFNLMPRRLVHEGDTLGSALRARGYRSVFAIDEVRFANFDESFGFDQLITPPIGATDFLLGRIGDLPLVNLVSDTRLGGWLFPSNHGNRAAAVTYRPRQFVDRVDRELAVGGPTFLFAHLTLSHWPYSWAEYDIPTQPRQYRIAYDRSVNEVDRQFAELWQVLERKGLFDNAIVVVFSDHGEAMGFPTDSMLRKTGTPDEIWNSLWGHGTSVVSPHQFQILLAMRAFGRARLPGTPAAHDWPVTLEDLRPTLEELATGKPPLNVDGLSLVPYLRDPAAAVLDSRVRFTETDFNTPRVLAGDYDEFGLVEEGAGYYEIVPESGWIQLRPDRLPELMRSKQRAAISRDALLASIPARTDGAVSWLFTQRRSPLPRALRGRPDAASNPEAARLWDALHARFPGELGHLPGLP